MREKDLTDLKNALLSVDSLGSAALTSNTGKLKSSRTAAHGMGGVGKTTIAAALVHDDEVRAQFDKIVWVSVGQEPDIRELQESIHVQLLEEEMPENIRSPELVATTLRNAAKEKVLLVCDDIWDPKHEKLLNCVDIDNGSRLLVTTRIRGLLKNSSEVSVGVLSTDDALELLLSSADMGEEAMLKGGKEHRIALEIVELCGHLPLTLAIAGGMVSNNPEGFTNSIVELMSEDHLREQDDDVDDGTTLEERVITSSLKMIRDKSKTSDLTVKIFMFFAVFPEDVPVPAGVFRVLASMLADQQNKNKANILIGTSLSTLVKYNLLKGSLMANSGVFMHDIVRDYVIHQHSFDGLRALQKSVVDAILASRPAPDGFPTSAFAAPSTFEGYTARQLFWHFRGALKESEEPPDSWIAHADDPIVSNAAMAMGLDTLAALSEARESAGDLVRAAQASWAASMMKEISQEKYFDFVYRSADLLELADDENVRTFESAVLSKAFVCDVGTERNVKSQKRSALLASLGRATFESKTAGAFACITSLFHYFGLFGHEPDAKRVLDELYKCTSLMIEAASLTDNLSWRSAIPSLIYPFFLGTAMVYSHLPQWDPTQFHCTEKGILDACAFYQYHVCGRVFKETGMRQDYFRAGFQMQVSLFYYGNCAIAKLWHEKSLGVFKEINLPSTKAIQEETIEVYNLLIGALPAMLICSMFDEVSALLTAIGITWNQEGFEELDFLMNHLKGIFPCSQQKEEVLHSRLLIILASPHDTRIESEVTSWMPSPRELADMENGYVLFKRYSIYDAISIGARIFLKLGRHDDAYELSRIAVSPEQKTEKKTTLVICHSILGQIAAKRGNLDEAELHFANALKEAKLSRLPMLEVLAAREWKRHLLEPNERECHVVEKEINEACVKMNKSRENIASLLVSGWYREATVDGKGPSLLEEEIKYEQTQRC